MSYCMFDNAEKFKRSDADVPYVSDYKPLDHIPVDIHNGRTFLIKIQISYTNDKGTMLVYDRQRTFNLFLHRENDPVLHDQVKTSLGHL